MNLAEAKSVIEGMALRWVNARLPNDRLTYDDFVKAITVLMLGNKDLDRTTQIFNILLNRAIELGESSRWLHTELEFESSVEFGTDRAVALRHFMRQDGTGSDASLDLFNERLHRFR